MNRLPPFSSLLTPEEPLLDDFGPPTKRLRTDPQGAASMGASKNTSSLKAVMQTISPPVSPQVALAGSAQCTASHEQASNAQDPLLFPETTVRTETSKDPLFEYGSNDLLRHSTSPARHRRTDNKSQDTQQDNAGRPLSINGTPPGVMRGTSRVGQLLNGNPEAYFRYILATNNGKGIHNKVPQKSNPALGSPVTITAASSASRSSKMVRAPSDHRIRRGAAAEKRQPHRRVAPAVRQKALVAPEDKAKAPVKKKTEDIDFESLEDFSPPISTLENAPTIRLEWPSVTKLSLADDPQRHLLHDIEAEIASKLRLSCATYLCSKRRIFLGRVEKLQAGREFRKTDAQQACKIDVNKASKLWTAYDQLGWFHPRHFEQRRG